MGRGEGSRKVDGIGNGNGHSHKPTDKTRHVSKGFFLFLFVCVEANCAMLC